jgi:hypothetical protein
MGIRGVAVLLWAALALGAAACSGDDEEPGAATATAPAPATTQPAATGATEGPPATTTEPEAEAEEEAEPAAGGAALIAEAAGKTAAAGSARVGTTVRITDPGLGQVRFSGRGAFDFDRREGELALRLVEGDDGGYGRSSQAVFQDTSAYYRLPSGALPGGKRWIRLELQDVSDASSLGLGPLVQGSQADPSQHLLWLTALDPAVSRIAEEEVRGVRTTRYRAAVDLGRLERQAPPGKEAEWGAYVQMLRDGLGLEFIPVEVWVDDDGRVRRLQHELGFADGRRAAVTTELSDFGVDVSAKAPPPGQVAALSDLIRP